MEWTVENSNNNILITYLRFMALNLMKNFVIPRIPVTDMEGQKGRNRNHYCWNQPVSEK